MSVPWNKSAYRYAEELEGQIVYLRKRIRQLEEKLAGQSRNETHPMFDSYGQYIGERVL